MKLFVLSATAAAAVLCASVVSAEPYVDYTPQKGVWHVTTVKVESNHLDDYVTSLKNSWPISEETA